MGVDPPQVDLCVIGGSEAGLAACVAAAALGLSVTLVDDGDPSGLRNPDLVLEVLRHAARACGNAAPRWPDLATPLARAAADRRPARLGAMNVRVLATRGRFTDRSTVMAGRLPIRARRFILAVGSRQPSAALAAALDPATRLTVADLGGCRAPPRRVVVLGGGPEAMAAAQSLQRLGAEATLVAPQLLPGFDSELTAPLFIALAQGGVRLLDGVRPHLCRPARDGIAVVLSDGSVIAGSHLLLAEAPVPALDDLGLGEAGIAADGGRLRLDPQGRTTNPRVFAIGRVADAPSTAAGIASVGRVLRAAFLLVPTPARPDGAAIVTATDPQVASVGLTEQAATQAGRATRVWRWPLAHTGPGALTSGPAGFVKVVTDRRGTVLGAGLVGPDVREMLGFWSLAVARRMRLSQLADVPLPAPSLSEATRAVAVSGLAARLSHPLIGRALRLARWID